MLRLSIFSSEQTTSPVAQDEPRTRQFRIRLFSPTSLMVLVIICLAEMMLRVDFVRDVLPQPNPYYQPGVETRLRALERVLAEYGQIDLLFIGSSVVRTNFQPLTFDREIAESTGVTIVSFNGALSGLPPDPVRLYLENFWLKHASPRIVLQGIRYSELRARTTAADFERFKAGMFEPKWLSSKRLAKLQLAAIENIRLFYYGGTLTETLRFFQLPINGPRGFPIDSRGYNATGLTLTEAKAAGLLEDAVGYSDEFTDESFRAGLQALERTIEICQKHGIEYVLVNMPEHGDKFLTQPDGRERYAFYLQQLQTLADSKGVDFVDLTNGDPATYRDDSYFSDYYHMSPFGAEKFTGALAEHLAAHLVDLFTWEPLAPSTGAVQSR